MLCCRSLLLTLAVAGFLDVSASFLGRFWMFLGRFWVVSVPKQLSTLAEAVGVPGSVANLPVVHWTNPGLQRCGPWLQWVWEEMQGMSRQEIWKMGGGIRM